MLFWDVETDRLCCARPPPALVVLRMCFSSDTPILEAVESRPYLFA